MYGSELVVVVWSELVLVGEKMQMIVSQVFLPSFTGEGRRTKKEQLFNLYTTNEHVLLDRWPTNATNRGGRTRTTE